MKDYRLSEIAAQCKSQDNCTGCPCVEFCANIGDYLVDPYQWKHIEPRDMIELPCKLITDFGDGTKMFQIVWRGAHSKLIVTRDFDNEHETEADEFLAQLKEKNNE